MTCLKFMISLQYLQQPPTMSVTSARNVLDATVPPDLDLVRQHLCPSLSVSVMKQASQLMQHPPLHHQLASKGNIRLQMQQPPSALPPTPNAGPSTPLPQEGRPKYHRARASHAQMMRAALKHPQVDERRVILSLHPHPRLEPHFPLQSCQRIYPELRPCPFRNCRPYPQKYYDPSKWSCQAFFAVCYQYFGVRFLFALTLNWGQVRDA